MGKEKINRRQMLRLGSLAAFSGLATHSIATSNSSNSNFEAPRVEIPGSEADLCFMNATDMATLIRTRKISAKELMQAHLKQIARVNVKVNSFVTLVPEDQLMESARQADDLTVKGKFTGPL